MAAYGVDTLDPGVSLRRVWVLANRLPPWARLPGEPWSAEADLLAVLVDHVAQLTWVTLQAAGAKGATRPKPIPRPPRPPARASAGRGASYATNGDQPAQGQWAAAVYALSGLPGVVTKHG